MSGFRDRKSLGFTLTLIAVVGASSLSPAGAADGSNSYRKGRRAFSASVKFGSDTTAAKVGNIVAQGTREDKICKFPRPVTIRGKASSPGSYRVSLRVGKRCQLVVSRKKTLAAHANPCVNNMLEDEPRAGLRIPSVHTFDLALNVTNPVDDLVGAYRQKGCVKYTILEQFGITATEQYHESLFWEKGDRVTRHEQPVGYCYHSAFPGWTIRKCSGKYKLGPASGVWAWLEGDYHNVTGPSYNMYSRYDFVPANSPEFQWQCKLTRGSLPVSWSEDCYGSYYPT